MLQETNRGLRVGTDKFFHRLKPPTTALCIVLTALFCMGQVCLENFKVGFFFFLTKSITSQPLESNPCKIVLLLLLASQAFLSRNGWSLMFSHMQQSLPLSQAVSLKMVLGFCACLFTSSCSTSTFSCPSSWLTVSW